jgi:hypothetical protein
MLGDFIQKPIRLQAEAGFRQEQYDIVLNWFAFLACFAKLQAMQTRIQTVFSN